ncbi:branched-chain amino acid transport system ATP-binding protein [Ochrobactrum daejeonense]|uniref:Branched-chain amino acid transport system ATP-binding protein n=1 Tax=Brucella daejeonensis TaxID=659015 RepID=A0A7W9EMN3_9HYPH|nr:ABC transporter ATP-binding protein [Brucella daejeonensis]MBB5703648.1 branched-chain amino acid transport system ATP-binding protein [Brucella daejeonensis]NKB79908.1 ABC transporter ATP-binding protein [Brucella daejeonensis]
MNAILRTENLVKRFAGLTATDHVTFSLQAGHIHALIGPNGAGKSTLIHQLCGNLMPNEGRILLGDTDITRLGPAERIGLGLGRTFQVTSLLGEFTVRENLGIAVQARLGGNMRIMDRVLTRNAVWEETDAMLSTHPLGRRRDIVVDDLSHGERKQLELLISLAGKPKVLLLDEPMAGLGHAESQEMVEVLQGLRGKVTILLVEHDMDAVFALADRISVLVYGRVILTGTAAEISASAEVREAYLGNEDEPC